MGIHWNETPRTNRGARGCNPGKAHHPESEAIGGVETSHSPEGCMRRRCLAVRKNELHPITIGLESHRNKGGWIWSVVNAGGPFSSVRSGSTYHRVLMCSAGGAVEMGAGVPAGQVAVLALTARHLIQLGTFVK